MAVAAEDDFLVGSSKLSLKECDSPFISSRRGFVQKGHWLLAI